MGPARTDGGLVGTITQHGNDSTYLLLSTLNLERHGIGNWLGRHFQSLSQASHRSGMILRTLEPRGTRQDRWLAWLALLIMIAQSKSS